MTREIKFRAWEKVREEDGEHYGGRMYYSEQCEEKRLCGFVIETNSGHSNDDFVWLQFTGLKDKNGKEIYEGDIVDWKPVGLGIIRYSPSAAFVHDQEKLISKTGVNQLHRNYQQEYTIIGNIYETPNLLKA
jgi:uncharacterized phage protein (TIGR01671 family)